MDVSGVLLALAGLLCLCTALIGHWRWNDPRQPSRSRPPAHTKTSIGLVLAALCVIGLPYEVCGDVPVWGLLVMVSLEAAILVAEILETKAARRP